MPYARRRIAPYRRPIVARRGVGYRRMRVSRSVRPRIGIRRTYRRRNRR